MFAAERRFAAAPAHLQLALPQLKPPCLRNTNQLAELTLSVLRIETLDPVEACCELVSCLVMCLMAVLTELLT